MPLPVISVAQMRAWEQATWKTGVSEESVIRRAGHTFAHHLLEFTGPADAILVLAGKGHNGDDARAAMQLLPDDRATLLNVKEPEAALPLLEEWLVTHRSDQAWIVDGLFGIGLNRPLGDGWCKLIQAINRANLPAAAVDVPSGLDADTGRVQGEAVRAAVTVTFGAPKTGLLEPRAAELVGRLVVAPEIGLTPCPFTTDLQWIEASDFTGFPPRRPVTGHKGTFGHLGILAGSPGYHGAAVLAALGAQRAQPGLITLVVPEAIYCPVASQLRSTMVTTWEARQWKASLFDAIIIGPGLAHPVLPAGLKETVMALWRDFPGTVVADASALDWLEPRGTPCAAPRIITPHPGEAARMLGRIVSEVQADRPGTVRELSRRYGGCQVVLKGHHTVVGSAEGPVTVNSSGNPHLAQGGAGDVLAGWLAGWLAQPIVAKDLPKCVRYAVWRHGAAADQCSRHSRNWTIDDLVTALGNPNPSVV